MKDTILNDGRTIEATLINVVCQTMPSVAAASGLCSQVDQSAALEALWASHGLLIVADSLAGRTELGLSKVRAWLEAQGVQVGVSLAREFRLKALAEASRQASLIEAQEREQALAEAPQAWVESLSNVRKPEPADLGVVEPMGTTVIAGVEVTHPADVRPCEGCGIWLQGGKLGDFCGWCNSAFTGYRCQCCGTWDEDGKDLAPGETCCDE